jgi:4-hydroxybenzoate polyprenyltransferase
MRMAFAHSAPTPAPTPYDLPPSGQRFGLRLNDKLDSSAGFPAAQFRHQPARTEKSRFRFPQGRGEPPGCRIAQVGDFRLECCGRDPQRRILVSQGSDFPQQLLAVVDLPSLSRRLAAGGPAAHIENAHHPPSPNVPAELIFSDLPGVYLSLVYNLKGHCASGPRGKAVFVWLNGADTRLDWGAYLAELRPHHWAKNLLVFLPAFAAHDFSGETLRQSLLAFLALSLCASAGYFINDLIDLANDRNHPVKRLRPVASGRIPGVAAGIAAGLLLAAGLAFAAAANAALLAVVAFYFVLSLTYTLLLKRRTFLDVVTLGLLYTLRIFAGAAATSIPVSPWLLAFSLFLFLSLAIVKRHVELNNALKRGQDAALGRNYAVGDLPILAGLAAASAYSAVVVLALYVNSAAVEAQYSRPELLWIVCVVLVYWLGRLLLLANRGQIDEDPIVFAFTDRVSLTAGAIVAAAAVAAALL